MNQSLGQGEVVSGRAEGLDSLLLRRAFSCFPSGVVSICALVDGKPMGLVASSFTSVSVDPPLVSFCIGRGSTTWPHLAQAPRLGVSVLGEAHQLACRQLAAKAGDRFAGLALETTHEGAIFIDGAPAWIDCSIEAGYPAGDHDIVLLRVHALTARPTMAPLVFHGSAFTALRQVAS